ncbi:MAG: PAS domain S-box protein [Oscillatoria sp. PMC 1068.18]|nr:PAS domain S-box protein [Oscillatoria sp. PMC 1076.18]MEC4988255.1 PAS domain S-box protein [Oscillatoria sp. PMC 1068.18]
MSQQIPVDLTQNPTRLQKLADNVLGILYQFQLDPNGSMSFPYVSAGCQEILELDPKLVQEDASLMINLIVPEDQERFQESVASSAQNLSPWYWEGRMKLASGVVKWIKAMSKPEPQPRGEILWDGWILDITEQKNTEAALQASNERITAILQGATEGFFALSDRWCFTYVNSQAEFLLGKSRRELMGRNIWELYPELVTSTFYQQYHYAVANQVLVIFEEFYQPLNSWFQVRAYPTEKELSVYFTNINDRKKLEISFAKLDKLNEELESKVRKRTAELAAKTTELEALWATFPDLVFCLTNDSTIVDYKLGNEEKATYLPPEEFLGKQMVEILPSEVGEKFRQAIKMTLQSQSLVKIEYSLEPETGKEYYEGRLLPFGEDRIMLIVRNISDRVIVETALRESEARLNTVVQSAPIILFAIDSQGKFTFSEGKGLEELQLRSGEVVGKSVWEIYQDFPEIIAQIKRGLAGENFDVIANLAGKLFETHYSPVKNENGEVISLIGVAIDVTERQQAEAQIRASQQRLSLLIEQTPIAVIEWNLNGETVAWNPAAEKIFGYSATEAIAANVAELIVPENVRPEVEQIMLDLLQKTGGFQSTNDNLTKDGKIITCEWYNAPLTNSNGEVISVASLALDISDRCQAEKLLQESEARLDSILSSLKDVVWSVDPETSELLYLNQASEQVYGRSVAEFFANSNLWFEVIHPEDQQPAITSNQWLLENQSREVEYRILRPDGEVRWLRDRAYLIYDQCDLIRIDGIATDITDRKQAEIKLQESEKRYQTLAEASPICVFYTDAQGNCLYTNDRWQEIAGITQAEALGEGWSQAIHPEDRERVYSEWYQTASEKKPFKSEYRFQRPDGQISWVIGQALPVTNDKGETTGYVGTITDISDRQAAEVKLQKINYDLQQAQRIAHIGSWEFDVNTGKISWTEELFHIYGLDPQKPVHSYEEHIQAYHPEDKEIFQEVVAAAIAEAKPYDLEARIIHPSGSIKHLHIKGEPVKNQTGEVIRLFGTVMDITNRKLAEIKLQEKAQDLEQTLLELQRTQAQLIQTEKMSSLGQMVAGVAHEINNPVNFIYGNLVHTSEYCQDLLEIIALYQENYPDPVPEVQEEIEAVDLEFLVTDLPKLVDSMEIGASRIKEIVASLRNFSRLDEAEYKSANLHEGIDSTLMILQNRIKAKPNHPEIEISKKYGNLPQVECYPGQLNQVFMNIFANALDSLEERDRHRTYQEIEQNPSYIWITTSLSESETIRISIKDNGLGIPNKIKDRIFDPFFTTKSVGKDTGLGMSISYQIITEKHRGKIECLSEIGQGAEFIIEIPLRQKT